MPGLRSVTATRYVTPLREGGSLPGLVEADDDGLYVLKFRGAGQGMKALVAEIVCGELARGLGLAVPEIVLMDVDPALGAAEPDPEIQDLITGSAGVNVGLDFLPGSLPYTPAAGFQPSASEAATVVWLDALISNVDRTPRNPNLLVWHERLWLIDHGAALFFHHRDWDPEVDAVKPFAGIADHVLLPIAGPLPDLDVPDGSGPRGGRRGAVRLDRGGAVFRLPDAPAGAPARMAAVSPFQYAIVRVVPRVERGECMNVGVVFFCRPRRYLAARIALDEARLAAFAPELDVAEVRAHLDAMTRIAEGDEDAGPVARLEQSERFHWLVAPSSTVIQTSPVHTGLSDDPEETLARLLEKLVA